MPDCPRFSSADFRWRRTGIAAKTRDAFGILGQGFQRRPLPDAKSVHMTCVPSCGNLGLLRSGDGLARCGALGGVVEMGACRRPWAMGFQRLRDIRPPIAEAFVVVRPCALRVAIAPPPRKRGGTRTGRGAPAPGQPWRPGHPWGHIRQDKHNVSSG